MSTTQLKREILELIDKTENENKLEVIYDILSEPADNLVLHQDNLDELKKRRNSYLTENTASYSLEEIRKEIDIEIDEK